MHFEEMNKNRGEKTVKNYFKESTCIKFIHLLEVVFACFREDFIDISGNENKD